MGERRQLGLVERSMSEVAHEAATEHHRDIEFMELTATRNRRPLFRHGSWGLVASLTRQQVISRYRQSSLRLAWIFVQPLVMVAVYALFFHGVLKVGSGDVPYLSFIVVGLIPWRFAASALSSCSVITDNVHMISKVYFPREVLPVVNVAAGLADLAIGTVIMLGVLVVQGVPLDLHVLALPLPYLLLVLVTTALTVVATTVAVFARDLVHAMPLVLIGVFFATPIMYTTEQLPSWLQWFPSVNPFAVVVTDVRALTIDGRWFPLLPYAVHLVAASLLLAASFAYTRSVETRMVDLA